MPSTCSNCSKQNVSMVCSRCKCTYYCDHNCQRNDWKHHKKICKSLSNKSKSNEEEKFNPIQITNDLSNIIDEEDIAQQSLKKLGYYINKNGRILTFTNNNKEHSIQSKDIKYVDATIIKYIDYLFQTKYKLQKIEIEEQYIEKQNKYISPGYIYISKRFQSKTILIIINGLGANDRTGIWSYNLCCSDSILHGTAFNYIQETQKRKWDIMIFDPNGPLIKDRKYPHIAMKTKYDQEHCIDMFKKYMIDTRDINRYDNIYFIGFSLGGKRLSKLLNYYSKNNVLLSKIKGIAFIDAVGIDATNELIKDNIYKKYAVNYKRDKHQISFDNIHSKHICWKEDTAGHTNHSWTPYCAINKVFEQFDSK